MNYIPGKKCVMWFVLTWPSAGHSPPALDSLLVTVFEKSKHEKVRRRFVPDGRSPSSPRGRALFVERAGALVQTFPADWKLPALAPSTDMDRMAPLLEEADANRRHASSEQEALPGEWTCERLRYHPNRRCVLRYSSDANGESRSVIGKVFRDPGQAKSLWQALALLSSESFSKAGWRSARPLLHVSELNLVLMERVAGRPLKSLLVANESPREIVAGVVNSATMLSALHGFSRQDLPGRSIRDDQAESWNKVRKVRRVDRTAAAKLGRVLSALGRHSPRKCRCPKSVIHGNASPSHFWIEGNSVSVIDVDGVGVGDPAIDVGSFLASLAHLAATSGGRRWRAVEDLFLEEYTKGGANPELVRRARVVQCQKLVRFAARAHLKAAPGDDRSETHTYLAEAVRCLRML
jgi:hypothetical protein